DLVGDAVGDDGQDVIGNARPVGGHRILAGDGPQYDGVAVGPPVALDSHGAHIGQEYDGTLPDRPVEAGLRQFGAGDGVGAAEDVQTLLGDLADDADAQAGAREGLTGHDGLGHAEFAADGSDLVLEQGAQRFDEFELDVIGQAADVVVALDVRRARSAAGFDDIGIQGPLDEEGDLLARALLGLEHEVGGGGLEGADEFAADDLAFGLRVGDPGQLGQELLARVHGDQGGARSAARRGG